MWTKKRIFCAAQPKLKLMTVNRVQVAHANVSINTCALACLHCLQWWAALSPVNTPTHLVGRCASVLGPVDWLCLQGGLPPDIRARALSPKDTLSREELLWRSYNPGVQQPAGQDRWQRWVCLPGKLHVPTPCISTEKAENTILPGRPIPVMAVWVLATCRMETGWGVLPGPVWAPSSIHCTCNSPVLVGA